MENKEEKEYPYSYSNDVFSKKALFFIGFCISVLIILVLFSAYGSYKLFKRNSDKAYVNHLEQMVITKTTLIKEREYKIKKLQKNIRELKIAMNYEKLFLLLAKPDTLTLLGDLEKYIKDKAEFCLKPIGLNIYSEEK